MRIATALITILLFLSPMALQAQENQPEKAPIPFVLTETELSKAARKHFPRMIKIAFSGDQLVLEAGVPDEAVRDSIDGMRKDMKNCAFQYRYKNSSGTSSSTGRAHTVRILYNPGSATGHLEFGINYGDSLGKVELGQTQPGILTFQYVDPETGLMIMFMQHPKQGCTLVAAGSGEAETWSGKNFTELNLNHPTPVYRFLIRPLEHYFTKFPITRMSGEVQDMVLSLIPPPMETVSLFEDLLDRLGNMDWETRERASEELAELVQDDPAALHWFGSVHADPPSAEIGARLLVALETADRSWQAYHLILENHLYYDIPYLASLHHQGERRWKYLARITGETFTTEKEWNGWYEQNRDSLTWSESAWRLETRSNE